MLPSGWLADEMLGRLARYLRFVGLDTVYARGLEDDEIVRRSRDEQRTLLTRDRALARRAEGSVLLTSGAIEQQWRELRARFPTLPSEPRYERCTLCNGSLERYLPTPDPVLPAEVPSGLGRSGSPLYRCRACGHLYWPGSHTDAVRARLERWSEDPTP